VRPPVADLSGPAVVSPPRSGVAVFGLRKEALPLAWDPTGASSVADTICYLLSDLARPITGEVLHVDCGVHAMATCLQDPPVEAQGTN